MIVQSKTTSKILKGSNQDVLIILQSMGFVAKKKFLRRGYHYMPINTALPSRTIVHVKIYQLFEEADGESPIQPPGVWIVEALVQSSSKDELPIAELALKGTAKALEDLVELKKIVF
ncbi:hypothetical protein MDAP_001726 [Mitosporidium daphniae]